MKKTGIFLLVVLIFLGALHIYTENTSAEKTLYLMDTVINIKIRGNHKDMEALCNIIKKYDLMLNVHDPNSEISKINNGKKEMSEDIKEILLAGYELSKLTEGAFDYTVKPLSDLWGISEGNTTIPKEEKVKEAVSKTGYEKIKIDGNNVELNGCEVDLGGIAKGYVTGKLIEEIKNRNIKRAIIDLGGNIYVLDSKKDVKVGVQKPFAPRGEVLFSLDVNDTSVISSGTYERYFEKNGKIYHHIFDRNTGYPAESKIESVTVVGEPTKGDALSTAILVMGIEEAIKLYKNEKDFEFIAVQDGKIYATEEISDKINVLDELYEIITVSEQ